MATYTFVCDMGHEPVTFTAEAETDEEAMTAILAQAKPHLEEAHADMGVMTDEQLMDMIKGKWTKA